MKISRKEIVLCVFLFVILVILSVRIIHPKPQKWVSKETDFGYAIRTGSIFKLQEEWVDKVSFYDLDETIDKLKNEKMSLARFGNGELDQILGRAENFQKPSEKLSLRLKEILASTDPRIGIGIPLFLFTESKRINVEMPTFWRDCGDEFRNLIFPIIKRKTFFASEITTRDFQSKYFFNKIRTLWQDRDVHLIHGEGILDNFKYDIFDNARSVTHQTAPSQNAFEEYDDILAKALKVDKNKIVIIILGLTATVLAYDLGKQGYQALDLGHIAKNYDWYKRGVYREFDSKMGFFYE